MKNWYSILTTFYAIRGGMISFMYGFLLIYLCRLSPTNWKLPIILLLGMLLVWLFNKLIFSVFELIIAKAYQKDPCNYCEGGFVINIAKKKVENVNHLISISERYKNSKYRDELEERFTPLFYIMFVIGLFVGFCIPFPSINM